MDAENRVLELRPRYARPLRCGLALRIEDTTSGLLVVGLNLLLFAPWMRPLPGHRYDGMVGFAARNNVHQLQTLARASPIVLCSVRHSRRPLLAERR